MRKASANPFLELWDSGGKVGLGKRPCPCDKGPEIASVGGGLPVQMAAAREAGASVSAPTKPPAFRAGFISCLPHRANLPLAPAIPCSSLIPLCTHFTCVRAFLDTLSAAKMLMARADSAAVEEKIVMATCSLIYKMM
jgi:hypothetical protein